MILAQYSFQLPAHVVSYSTMMLTRRSAGPNFVGTEADAIHRLGGRHIFDFDISYALLPRLMIIGGASFRMHISYAS
jgi:hypothetical protein